jgi:hypothetical protein
MTTAESITVEYLIKLAQRLSPSERARLRVALTDAEEVEARAAQRKKNQTAISALDSLFFDDAPSDEEQEDSWWPDFRTAMNTNRTSNRPLYPQAESVPDAIDRA